MSFFANCGSRPIDISPFAKCWITNTPYAKVALPTIKREIAAGRSMDANTVRVSGRRELSSYSIKIESSGFPLHFSRVNVAFSDYAKKYQSAGWMGRKAAILPDFLLALARIIVHAARLSINFVSLTITTFIDPDFSIEKKREHEAYLMQRDFYTIGRDLEEAVGTVVRIFSDQAGSYLVEDSLFHKEYYFSKE